MQDSLKLNRDAVKKSRNQFRVWQYCSNLGIILNVKIPDEKYLPSLLVKSDFLLQLINHLQIEIPEEIQEACIFECFDMNITDEEKKRFCLNCIAINNLSHKIDATISKDIPFTDYFQFISHWITVFTAIQKVEHMPAMDFNDDMFISQYEPSNEEIKLMINLEGVCCLDVKDINAELGREPRFYENNLWVVYTFLLVSACSLSLSMTNISYYIQILGATATQVASQTTFFNLVQLFSSVFWLWLSDKIGRKPIAVIMGIIYTITSGLFLITLNMTNNQNIIRTITIIRASQGSVAIIVPLAVVIVADRAAPKIRGFVMVLVNVSSVIGAVLSSALQIYFSSAQKYNTSDRQLTFSEIQRRSMLGFQDSNIAATVLFGVCLLIIIIFLKESNQNIITIKCARKLGLTIKDSKSFKTIPIHKVFVTMIKDYNLDLIFLSYFLSLTGSTNSRTGAPYYTTRSYDFTNPNEAKGYISIVLLVTLTLASIISALLSKYFIKYFGEFKSIIFSQFISIVESIILFLPNPPINPALLYLTQTLTGISIIFCDSLFFQLVSMYTVPQNRGQILGIFQIGNSLGRVTSGAITGIMQGFNYRDSQIFNTLFQSGCLILLSLIKPPIQRTQMDKEYRKQETHMQNDARV
ncbi:Major facilitator superfamily protein [Spironucleus salmonicida]|uniref:Major facilitator superfamily protein n=1 Tax=Spironucleus salmonicida TaxID=348837 RepID=V6LFF9_9EUKA|nr:Major facilitator superfamily protein [Spironucleus salmonicida]|eukprot:EST43275.1 Major facilitator superfamily protein [Spironucleus salmonicida]